MGLLTSVNNLNYTLQEKENEKLRREKERIKAKEEKEEKERIKNEIEQFLHLEFYENLQKFGSNYVIEYYNINKVHALLGAIWSQHILEKEIKLKNKKPYTTRIIQHEKFIEDYFYKKYYKILKEEEEIANKNESYIYYNTLQQQQKQYQQQMQYQNNINNLENIKQKKQKQVQIFKNIVTIFCGIIFLPLRIYTFSIIRSLQKSKIKKWRYKKV